MMKVGAWMGTSGINNTAASLYPVENPNLEASARALRTAQKTNAHLNLWPARAWKPQVYASPPASQRMIVQRSMKRTWSATQTACAYP